MRKTKYDCAVSFTGFIFCAFDLIWKIWRNIGIIKLHYTTKATAAVKLLSCVLYIYVFILMQLPWWMASVAGRRYATGPKNCFSLRQTSLTSIAKPVWLAVGEEPEDADLEAPKVYEPVTSLDSLKDRLGSFIASYNEMVRGGHMDLVFFKVQIIVWRLCNLKTQLYFKG